MKIRRLIIMIVLLLACVGVSKGQYTFENFATVEGDDVDRSSFNDYVVVFGNDFFVHYTFDVRDRNHGNQYVPIDPSLLRFEFYDNNKNKISETDIKRLPVGVYYFKAYYGATTLIGGISQKKLTIEPRNIWLKFSKPFYGAYQASKPLSYSIKEFYTKNKENLSLSDFMNSCTIVNLASFDEQTEVDFANTTFTFADPEPSDEKKNPNPIVEWKVKAKEGADVDWSENYNPIVLPEDGIPSNLDKYKDLPKPLNENLLPLEGYINLVCPYDIVWKTGDATVSENVELTYGNVVGVDYSTQTNYDLAPLMYDNGVLVDDGMTIERTENNGVPFKPYDDGDIIHAGDYMFKATSVSTPACKSQIAVKVNPILVKPKPVFPHEKVYDGTNLIVEDGEWKIKDGYIIPYTITYDNENVGTNKLITILFKNVQGEHPENYALSPDTKTSFDDGVITAIQPDVRWYYKGTICENQGHQTISNSESVKNVSASLDFGNDELDAKYLQDYEPVYKLELDGNEVDVNAKLDPTKTYVWSVTFNSNNPTNLLPASSSIEIYVKKSHIALAWNGTNKDQLEYPKAKVADPNYGFGYLATNASSKSDIVYEYYLSSDLNITEDELLSNPNNKVEVDFAPLVGKYMFGCIAKDVNGYMLDGQIMDQIEIKKSSVLMKIDEPTIETKRDYEDGNVQAKVTQPARFNGRDLPTTAYFVDGITASDIVDFKADVTESNFTEEVGGHFVFYKIDIPEDMAKNSNYYIKSERNSNGDIVYYEYKSGEYIYVTSNGEIKCLKIVLDPVVPENAVYGKCTLGGNTPNDMRIYPTYNGNIIPVEGEWVYYGVPSGVYEPGKLLDAKDYKMFAWFDPHDDKYCKDASTNNFSFTVHPLELTSKGELLIADKTYDGTTTIESNQIIGLPTFDGILEKDLGEVSVTWDYTDTKYPSPDIKYTDETKTVLAAYTDIPATASLSGNRASNYKLPKTTFCGSSTILPEINIEIEYISPQPPENVLTYRLVYGESVMGVDFRVKDALLTDGLYARYLLDYTTDRTFKMQSPKENPDEFFNYEVQIVKGNRDEDAADNTYDVVARQRVRIYVDKFQLKISTPNIVKQKIYDGNTSVAWTNGNNCEITNYVDGDDVALDGEPVIEYDTPEVGTGKTITATYTLKGNDLYKYLPPDNYTTTGSITKKPDDPKDPEDPQDPKDPENPPTPGKITIADVTPVSGGGGTVSPNEDGYCAGEQITLNIKIAEGAPTYCKLVFDEKSKTAGFKDVDNGDLVALGNGVYQTAFECPGATYGKYGGQVYLYDDEGNASTGYLFELQVNYSSKYLKAKFNDVVLVDNHEIPRLFSEANPDITYQWYIRENGVDQNVPGETKQFYNVPTMDAWYGAYAKTSGDEWIKICPKYFGKTLSKSYVEPSVSVYPNPATSMEPVTIKINDFESDSYKNVIIYLYNSTGSLIKTIENVEELNVVSLPFGNYSGIVVFDGNKISFKFIVRK